MKFYHVYNTTYHNNTCIGTYVSTILTDKEPKTETILLTWDNLEEYYNRNFMFCKFNIWNFKKGRRVSFFTDTFLFAKKDERDVKEWKEELNIRIETTYKEFNPSIAEVLKYYDTEKAIAYLNEKGLKIN